MEQAEHDYGAMLGWAKFCASSDKPGVAADTRRALERAIHRSSTPEVARLYLGRVERMLGREQLALHHFREVGDFGAHTQEDQEEPETTVIDVDRDEAEWTLDLVDRLFDYFIITPAKDEAIKRKVDEKGKRAGRKSLRPEAEEES